MNFPGLRHTILISEPEAAALYAARWLTRREDAESLVVSLFQGMKCNLMNVLAGKLLRAL